MMIFFWRTTIRFIQTVTFLLYQSAKNTHFIVLRIKILNTNFTWEKTASYWNYQQTVMQYCSKNSLKQNKSFNKEVAVVNLYRNKIRNAWKGKWYDMPIALCIIGTTRLFQKYKIMLQDDLYLWGQLSIQFNNQLLTA